MLHPYHVIAIKVKHETRPIDIHLNFINKTEFELIEKMNIEHRTSNIELWMGEINYNSCCDYHMTENQEK